MENMIGQEVPDKLPPIKYIDISNEEYQKIMNLFQPERLNPEEVCKNEDEIIRKICEENPSYYDPNGELPLVFDKNGKRLNHQDIMNLCDSPNTGNK